MGEGQEDKERVTGMCRLSEQEIEKIINLLNKEALKLLCVIES